MSDKVSMGLIAVAIFGVVILLATTGITLLSAIISQPEVQCGAKK